MAISPPSDLVLDAMRAADPARAAAVSQRLAQAAAQKIDAAQASTERAQVETQARNGFDQRMRLAGSASRPAAPANAVGRGLEEMLLTQMLNSALPNNAASVYGAGAAGAIWRGLFADQLARTLARQDRLGLAAHLAPAGKAT